MTSVTLYAIALSIMVTYVGRSGFYRHAHAALVLLAAWVATLTWQRFSGEFAPFPDLAVIDALAIAAIMFRGPRYRWEVMLAAMFGLDIGLHTINALAGVPFYVAGVHVVAYGQIALLTACAWHGRRGFASAPSWVRWLSGSLENERAAKRG